MFESFDDCMHAALQDEELYSAGGAEILKQEGRFYYALYGKELSEGEPFLTIARSSTPEVDWRVFWHSSEAQGAYHAFILDPRNGELGLA